MKWGTFVQNKQETWPFRAAIIFQSYLIGGPAECIWQSRIWIQSFTHSRYPQEEEQIDLIGFAML